MPETVTIMYDQWEEMNAELRYLEALRQAGVENWEGFDAAEQRFATEEALIVKSDK